MVFGEISKLFSLTLRASSRSGIDSNFRAYDERKPIEPSYPSILPSVAGLYSDVDSDPEDSMPQNLSPREKIELKHAPPGPAYFGLTTNISTKLQEIKNHPWKEGTGDFVNVKVVGDYLENYSRRFHMERVLRYHTKVETINKIDGKWIVRSKFLNRNHGGSIELIESEEVSCNSSNSGISDTDSSSGF